MSQKNKNWKINCTFILSFRQKAENKILLKIKNIAL